MEYFVLTNPPILTPYDNACIGAVVVAYGYLEHELIRAAISVSGGPKDISDKDNKKIENVLEDGSALKARLQVSCGLAKKYKALDSNQIADIYKNMELGIKYRNMVCHGLWQRLSTGQLRVQFYSKGCVSAGSPEVGLFSQNDLKGIAKVSFDCAKELSEL